jgi:hypothetical protein
MMFCNFELNQRCEISLLLLANRSGALNKRRLLPTPLGIRLAREKQVNVRVIPTSHAIDEWSWRTRYSIACFGRCQSGSDSGRLVNCPALVTKD